MLPSSTSKFPISSPFSSPFFFSVMTLFLFSPFFIILFFFASPFITASDPSTIYDHLHLYGLPIGLLPKNITKFSIDSSTGRFQVFLDQPCNAKFENEVHYDFNVSGRLSYGQIAELAGISSQELFLWFPVKGIRVDLSTSGLIHFDVGVVDKQFSLSLFESPIDCTAADPVDRSIAFNAASLDMDRPLSTKEDQRHNPQLEVSELRASS
ncbi:uncharacterized protein LOC101222871 [Cucumis sativus]|uniref:DUF538 domain-containing protein n=1 Tax=Cucumis sativus TaxID=3659 RepID=A0A0A0LN19_CUCSA|nr:uncharacterized protein LOC101222871 [Cucumis sativus]KGN61366.1 hypothetical protein Csa_005959 [Cucumis sativus]